MTQPQFRHLLFSTSLDTWIIASETEVDDLIDYLYHLLIGHELKRNSRKTKEAMRVVLLNLYTASVSDPKLFIRYSRDENFYGTKLRRYLGTSIAYEALMSKVIPGLIRLKLIEDHKGFNDRREFGEAFMSRMRAKPKLIKLFDRYDLQPWMLRRSSDREVLVLKDKDKKFAPYKDTNFTNTAREELQHINRHLEAATIDLCLSDEAMVGLLRDIRKIDDIEDEERHLSLFSRQSLYRIFSNSSWKLHGRFYGGWWQQIPQRIKAVVEGKKTKVKVNYRQHITINGDPTVELDYSSFHPKMIYDLAGFEMTDDPYQGIGDLDRAHGKSIFNMMLNAVGQDKATSREKAIGAYQKEYRDEGMTKKAAKAAIDAVLERHKSIRKRFFSGFGLKLMFYDSQIANNVMFRAINEYQTVVLPVHDSFISVQEFEDNLRDLMVEEYQEVMKVDVPPGVDMKESIHYISKEEAEERELYEDEYGSPVSPEVPLDPLQKQRREWLEKQAA